MMFATGCGWLDVRNARLNAAIAHLKAQCILVSIRERRHPIRAYRVSGRPGYWLAEDVVALAERKGLGA
jgi:hypothetical protein